MENSPDQLRGMVSNPAAFFTPFCALSHLWNILVNISEVFCFFHSLYFFAFIFCGRELFNIHSLDSYIRVPLLKQFGEGNLTLPHHYKILSIIIFSVLFKIFFQYAFFFHFTYDNVHVLVLFSQIIPPSHSPTESKRLFYKSVSLLPSCIQDYHYHLSKFHIYIYMCVLVYYIVVSLSGLLHYNRL